MSSQTSKPQLLDTSCQATTDELPDNVKEVINEVKRFVMALPNNLLDGDFDIFYESEKISRVLTKINTGDVGQMEMLMKK